MIPLKDWSSIINMNFLQHLSSLLKKVPLWLVNTLATFLTLIVNNLLLGIVTLNANLFFSQFVWKYFILNTLTLGIFWCFLLFLTNRVWLSNLLCSAFCGILAVVNHYVIEFHGMPVSFLLLRNLKTAMNVISAYKITLNSNVVLALAVTCILVVFALVLRRFSPPSKRSLRTFLRDVGLLVVCICILYFGYLSNNPVKPKKTIGWLWSEAYATYGYVSCTVESFIQSFDVINEPEGYSESALDRVVLPESSGSSQFQTPDIILILNESFYDLRQVSDFQTDYPFLDRIENMDNLLRGYAVVSNAGGGTNNSEYELLTSNSLYLMPGVTPFNTLDLNGANSIVSHLLHFGYYTLGSHCLLSPNYSRGIAYPALQFQDIYFHEDFNDLSWYGDRYQYTDKSCYSNLIHWYEEAPEDSPRFLYLLTMQNHGGYDINSADYDLIHVESGLDGYTDLANEYLSCISLSDEAFYDLTTYFSTVDRPVIVCMVGDHAPSFVTNVTSDRYSSDEAALLQRSVPLLIWANYPLEDINIGTISMNYVVPTLLEIAGLPSSPYYSYMLQLKEQVPILTSYGSYYDVDGNLYTYSSDDNAPYEDAVNGYFYLEYENLQSSRNQSLFDPYSK